MRQPVQLDKLLRARANTRMVPHGYSNMLYQPPAILPHVYKPRESCLAGATSFALGADLTAEHLAHHRREACGGEGLEEQGHAGVEPALVDDGVARIAGGEEHLEIGPATAHLIGKLSPIEP